MDFEAAWEYLRKHTPLRLETADGTPFTVEVSDQSIAYKSARDQRRPQSKHNFEVYFRTWFEEGRRDRSYFTNFGKERSPSARFRYFSAVFRHLGTADRRSEASPAGNGVHAVMPSQNIHNDLGLPTEELEKPIVKMAAEFSPCKRYRYALWRTWDASKPYVMMIMLNPSIADEKVDSRTSGRCIEFAKGWGYGGLCIGNLFAFRSQDKELMKEAVDPIGPDNDEWLVRLAKEAGVVVAAWGNDGSFMNRAKQVIQLVGKLSCLKLTREGQPAHPLYLPAGLSPIPFVG
jgi:hypothetical protein